MFARILVAPTLAAQPLRALACSLMLLASCAGTHSQNGQDGTAARPRGAAAQDDRALGAGLTSGTFDRAEDIVLIVHGGVGTLEHMAEGLRIADAALAASIFHDGKHTVQEAKAYLRERGIDVRP